MIKIAYKKKSNAAYCDAIDVPVLTEKSYKLMESGIYAFRIKKWADKNIVNAAVSNLFDVEVVEVNIINMKGRPRFFKGKKGKAASFKKAMVKLKSGQSIDLAQGV